MNISTELNRTAEIFSVKIYHVKHIASTGFFGSMEGI